MQAGSFVATTSSPPVQSTRNLAACSWKGKVDRQLSMDRSVVSISGSFCQSSTSYPVPVKNAVASGSTPWTPAPPRSPRQRTHSPLRFQPAPASAVVLTRDHEDPHVDAYPEPLMRKKSLDATLRMPFLSVPMSQRGPADKTPQRSTSPRQRAPSPAAVRHASGLILTKDADESLTDISIADRLLSSSCRSPAAARPVPRIASWQHTSQVATGTATGTSPRYERNPSPFRWSNNWKTASPSAPVPSAEDRVSSNAGWAMSAVVMTKNADESLDMSQGQFAPKASATQRASRVTRQTSPGMRARTLSPARPNPHVLNSSPQAMGLSKERSMANSIAAAPGGVKDVGDVPPRLPRHSAAHVLAKDEAEVQSLKRPSVASAVVPPKDAKQEAPETLEPPLQGVSPSYQDLKPWLEAAQQFQMNTDFNLDYQGKPDFGSLMAAMKKESAGKWTIQTMADKLLLNGILENLGLPHMPMIFASRSLAKLRERLEVLVDKLIIATAKKQPYDIIVKPTHLSSAQGVMSFNRVHQSHREDTINQLEKHMRKYIETQANKQESLALQSLKPGFIGQPKYKSVVGFRAPLELKVCALWGKVRAGVWWWGTRMAGPAQIPHRNVWIVRDPVVPGELSERDGWEVIHNHPGGNPGWEQAVKLFKRHMPDMAALTETLATALGTPFLRADFFVGSSKWGVRLNEVAYGCGLEYRNLFRDGNSQRVIDDKPAMSEILRQGMALCHRRLPPQHFLQMLGVQGTSYEDTAVMPLGTPLTTFAANMNQADRELLDYTVEEDLCKSVKELPPREGEPQKESKENPAKLLDPVQPVVRKPQFVKPHTGHIPTLVMPHMAKVIGGNPHVLSSSCTSQLANYNVPTTSLKAPMSAAGYVQPVSSACAVTKSQSARPAVVLRAPLR